MSAFVKPSGSWEPRASARVPEKETWIHFAATYDSKAKNEHLIVYVNGIQAGQSTRPGKITATENPVEIGRWGKGSFFAGIIDEVAIFNIVLGEEDLQAIMDQGLANVIGGDTPVSPIGMLASTWSKLKYK